MSAIDFCACSAYFARLTEVLYYLSRGSFNRRLLYLETVMSINLIDKMKEYGVQFISDCLYNNST